MPDPVQEVYVGPRPFERSERSLFFGRDREISELLSLVTSSRIVLCYAPSGAGKTSLINAGLQPRLEHEGFEVLPSARVRGLIPEGIEQAQVPNLYIFNALLTLSEEGGAAPDLAGRSLREFLAARPSLTDEEDFPRPRILIFDQFEELLTSYQERWHDREGFFQQVHDALEADALLRVMFVMREDFLARIEPFLRLLKPFPLARFRLDLLGKDGARAAVTGPLRGTNRHFKEGTAEALIEELLKVRVEASQGDAVEVVGEYVEPVQLQVVCRNLWTSLPLQVEEIGIEHLEIYGDVNQALRQFYESCVVEAKASLGANERSLRRWFDHQLITPAGTRGIVFRDANHAAGLPNPVVDFLENRHLIRGEWRAGSRWYELTHDRFIEPIQRSNERWQSDRQVRTSRLIFAALLAVVLLPLLFVVYSSGNNTSASAADVSTIVAATVVVDRATAQVQAQVAEADVALSRSRQLAAEAFLVNDPDLALLLAIRANQADDTLEARRSLHRILSRQGVIDGEFLRELDPQIFSPSLSKRWILQDYWAASLAISPDGRRLVSGGEEALLTVWDLTADKPTGVSLDGHQNTIQGVAYSPDGAWIASAGQDGQVLLWRTNNQDSFGPPLLAASLLGHHGWVTCVAFSPDGKRLASGGDDGTVRIWDVSSEQPQENVQIVETGQHDVWSLAWSPDGTFLATAGTDSTVRLWNTIDPTEPFTLSGHQGVIRAVAWSPDGQSLASGSYIEETNDTRGEVIVWDVRSGQMIARTPDRFASVRTLAFDPSGKILAIGQYDGNIMLWSTGNQPGSDNLIQGLQLKAHTNRVMSIVFSPDGRYMVSSGLDQAIALWDLTIPTTSIEVSLTGNLLAASQGAAISLWDVSTSSTKPITVFAGHTEDVLSLAFSPDESLLVSGSRDDTIRLWNVTDREEFQELTGHSGDVISLDISPDGASLASACENGEIFLWDLATGLPIHAVYLNEPVIKVWFREDGQTLQVAGRNGSLTLLDPGSVESQEEAPLATQAGLTLSSLAVSPNGQSAAFSTELDAALQDDTGRAHGIELPPLSDSFDPAVNPDDIDFIVVKASEGLQADARFEEFLPSIRAVPIRGAMHVYQPRQPLQEQADLFLSLVKDQGFHFYVLDLEITPNDGSTAFLSDAEQWMNYVQERVEGKVIVQTNSFYLTRSGPAGEWMKQWPLLIMSYPEEPDPNGNPPLMQGASDWKLWQYTARGEGAAFGVAGTSVPLEVYNGTPQEMWTWLELPDFAIYDRGANRLIRPSQAIQVTGRNGIAYSPDSLLVAAAGEGKVSLLNAASGEEETSLSLSGRTALSLSFTSRGETLVIGMDDGTILLWDLSILQKDINAEATLTAACSQVTRDFTESEWRQFFGASPQDSTCSALR